MDILIDASAILAVLLNEPGKSAIIEGTSNSVLIAPGCIEYEIGNAISALCKRNLLEISDGVLVWHEFCKIPLRQILPPFPEALLLAGSESIYAYDAYYISCAELLGIPLLTLDTTMKQIASKRGIVCLEV
jgi:predicted nucleic acid-binding protein